MCASLDNQDLGDLSELSDSIAKKGIMQNLTVIPGHWLTDAEWSAAAKEYQETPRQLETIACLFFPEDVLIEFGDIQAAANRDPGAPLPGGGGHG